MSRALGIELLNVLYRDKFHSAYQFEEKTEIYKKAIRLNPKDADAHYRLGRIYLELGNKADAYREGRILYGLDSDLADLYYLHI